MVREGDHIAGLVEEALSKEGLKPKYGDIFVVSEKVVAKSQGRVIELNEIEPSERAEKLAGVTGKDPRLVEVILGQSKEVLYAGKDFILTETRDGLVCANAGVDQSNLEEGRAKLLPSYPHKSAEEIRAELEEFYGLKLAVIIADSMGRSFRRGSVGIALGSSGVVPLVDRRGERDLYHRELEVTRVAQADNIASMGNLVMGEGSEGIPVVMVRGLEALGEGKAKELVRGENEDIAIKCLKRFNKAGAQR